MSDALLKEAHKILSEGWGAIDGGTTSEQKHKQAMEQFEFCQAVASAFTGKGKGALHRLRERFYDPPTWTPNVTNINDTTAYGFIREGQKSVITFIQNCIAAAEKGPPQPPEKPKQE
jgi:hypothetical protein